MEGHSGYDPQCVFSSVWAVCELPVTSGVNSCDIQCPDSGTAFLKQSVSLLTFSPLKGQKYQEN